MGSHGTIPGTVSLTSVMFDQMFGKRRELTFDEQKDQILAALPKSLRDRQSLVEDTARRASDKNDPLQHIAEGIKVMMFAGLSLEISRFAEKPPRRVRALLDGMEAKTQVDPTIRSTLMEAGKIKPEVMHRMEVLMGLLKEEKEKHSESAE